MLPRDVDLTLRMDFNKHEDPPKSIKLTKTKKDESYKRYNEYEDKSFSSTTSSSLESSISNFTFNTRSTSTTADIQSSLNSVFDRLYGRNIIKKEERICWRKLYKDPNIYGEIYSSKEEAIDDAKNYNFAMGSKQDRLRIHYRKLKNMEDFGGGVYCDCCGKKLNLNNCLTYRGALCQKCNKAMYEENDRVRL